MIRHLHVGQSRAIRDLMEQARLAAATDSPVLIQGETGTGKSVLARWLHHRSSRASNSMLELNCGGFSKEFLETELFGHERGAFTGAANTKVGLLEAADRGTVFLDEIGDMDLQVQPKILKVLEEKRCRRLGGVQDRKIDFRLIAATHQMLDRLVEEKRFRMDLFYRISAIQIVVPPLRDRAEDVLAYTQVLLERIADDGQRGPIRISQRALVRLQEHSWPGNIRELRNVLERAVMRAGESAIDVHDLDFAVSPGGQDHRLSSGMTLKEMERHYIIQVLNEEGGRVDAAAIRLDIPRSTLYQKLRAYGRDCRLAPRSGGPGEGFLGRQLAG